MAGRNYRGSSHKDPVGRGILRWANGDETRDDVHVSDGRFWIGDWDVTDSVYRDLGPRKARRVLRDPGRYAKKTARKRSGWFS